jgi:hypothetical protein
MTNQCEVMLITQQCPNPAVDGFDRCIVHLGSNGFEHWFAAAKYAEEVGTKAATYIGYAVAVWHVIRPFLKAEHDTEREIEYARIQAGLQAVIEASQANPRNPRVTPLKNDLETLVIDFYNFTISATATAEDDATVMAGRDD